MNKAIYHQSASERVELEVIASGNGKVDLGRDKVIIVKGCPVTAEPHVGCATLIDEKKTEKSLDRMNKDELLALAKERSLEVDADMTKAQIIEAIEKAAKAAESLEQ